MRLTGWLTRCQPVFYGLVFEFIYLCVGVIVYQNLPCNLQVRTSTRSHEEKIFDRVMAGDESAVPEALNHQNFRLLKSLEDASTSEL